MKIDSALADQTVVIVGGSSGVGLAIGRLASQAGARKVVLIGRSRDKLDSAAAAIGGANVDVAAADMVDSAALTDAIRSAGTIDHLVLTAVADEKKRIDAIAALTDAQMEGAIDKLRGFFFAARAAAPIMRERGSMIFTSGASALKPPARMSILAAVNASIVTLAHALAIELAPVRVNALTPGLVDTPIHQGEEREGIRRWAESELPARRFGQPSDLAHAALFLMTNAYVTGQNLVVDGGLVAR
ncbi:SDR family oxidoreductase [Pendulispora brunnea]|uniref:SDR family oxidoreductase n=1 Tax=Pendulispora brunnea TaxID=2905690 RepID=A0ABZ2K697_9BACT